MAKPHKLRIPRDGHRFENVGRLPDGTQFLAYVTGAYPADWYSGKYPPEYLRERWAEHKGWYAVLHRFDSAGDHIGTDTRLAGHDIEGRDIAGRNAWKHLEEMWIALSATGKPESCDVRIKLFSVEMDGVQHGLFYQQSEEDPESDWVMLEPRDIMFHPPWDSGKYST